MEIKNGEFVNLFSNLDEFESSIDDHLKSLKNDKMDTKDHLLKMIVASMQMQNHLLIKRNELIEEQNQYFKDGLGIASNLLLLDDTLESLKSQINDVSNVLRHLSNNIGDGTY